VSIGRNATWVRAEESKERKKETQRCEKSHNCPDHPRCAFPTKVVMWGGVPDVVNHAIFIKIGSGVLALRGSKSAILLCLALWLIEQVKAIAQLVTSKNMHWLRFF